MGASLPHPFSIFMELLLMDLPFPSQMWLLLLMWLPRTASPRGPTPLGVENYYKTYFLLFVFNRTPIHSITSLALAFVGSGGDQFTVNRWPDDQENITVT